MCLGIPMQIVAIDGYNARCTAKGEMREVSLFMLQDEPIAVDDFVMVHAGYALQKMSEQEARSTWALLDEILAYDSNVVTHSPAM
jgi:hydrogenase expression/formation protein HypC